ncbi:MAG: DUF3078 domain-containing protein [Chloroflexota bacterium]
MNGKLLVIAFSIFTYAGALFSQVVEPEAKLRELNKDTLKGWYYGGLVGLNFSQVSLTNWAAGGENSLALNGLFSVFSNYKEEKMTWDNSLDVGYGFMVQGKKGVFIKTDDKFDALSKYGRKAFDNVYYAALLNFKTQMSIGRDYKKDTSKISNFMAPAYLIGALGMDYKPNSYLSAFAAPVTGKITFVEDQDLADSGAYGVKPAVFDAQGNLIRHGETRKIEFGGYIRIIYTKNDFATEALKNVSLTSKIDLFSNYLKNPQNIDVSWENIIAFRVNKYITFNISTHLLYDDDITINIDNNDDGIFDESGPRTQFKEILAVGFSYKF